jgi:hypothetical protein
MNIEKIQKYKNKKVFLQLANGFKYTTTLNVENDDINFKDRYGEDIDVDASFIVFIKNAEVSHGK